jgi:hypothetical protein
MRHRPDAVADRLRRDRVEGVEQGTEPVGKQVGALRGVRESAASETKEP